MGLEYNLNLNCHVMLRLRTLSGLTYELKECITDLVHVVKSAIYQTRVGEPSLLKYLQIEIMSTLLK